MNTPFRRLGALVRELMKFGVVGGIGGTLRILDGGRGGARGGIAGGGIAALERGAVRGGGRVAVHQQIGVKHGVSSAFSGAGAWLALCGPAL
mgnify:CR=1 FL=1